MIIDLLEVSARAEITADVIVIGGGMAGITLAREWAGRKKTVAILESGGREADDASQKLYAGTGTLSGEGDDRQNIDDYLVTSRARFYGGSGHWWGGKSVPLDPADFAARPWIKNSGWPMSRADLQPYYDRACDVLSIPYFDKDYAEPQHEGRPPLDINGSRHITSLPRDHSEVSGRIDKARFDDFRYGFTDEPNVSVYLHANVVGFDLADDGSGLRGVEVSTLDGKRSRARGDVYVLACGGIENARLLLAANARNGARFGSRSDALGRYFQGHTVIYKEAANKEAGTELCFTDPPDSLDLYVNRRLGNPHAVLGTTLLGQQTYECTAFTVTMGLLDEEPRGSDRFALRSTATRIDQASSDANDSASCWCYFMTENLPNPESRITLTDRNDALGMPRVHLDWKYGADDLDGFERSLDAFVRELGTAGQGRVCSPVERNDAVAAMQPSRHHMGTTRMHDDPTVGVVDANLKCHDADNLYVAGSSVFPTSGIANPTLTLLALTLRLSDHLKERLGV